MKFVQLLRSAYPHLNNGLVIDSIHYGSKRKVGSLGRRSNRAILGLMSHRYSFCMEARTGTRFDESRASYLVEKENANLDGLAFS